MRLKVLVYVGLLATVFLLSPSVAFVFADVPSVLELTTEKDGGDNFLVIEVRHSSPTSSHYVDIIEIEIDGELKECILKLRFFTKIDRPIFTYKIFMNYYSKYDLQKWLKEDKERYEQEILENRKRVEPEEINKQE